MRKRRARLFTVLIALICVGVVAAGIIAYRPAIATIAPPDAKSFPIAQVERGATLSALGDCAVCHTAEAGKPFAGGRPLATPFGTIYATNITPDGVTGIGGWSIAAFRRAMRQGIARDGTHLYPAFPYDNFTKISDDDLDALYAFLMTRQPVVAQAPANRLIPPLGFRPLMAGWNLLFLREARFTPVAGHDAVWNRGAYLVEGLGHCGACHTPRNILGARERDRPLAGGRSEGWVAPPLTAANPAPDAWTVAALSAYLRTGIDPRHNAAAGPMGPVTHDLSGVPDADVHAIAVYIAAAMGNRTSRPVVDNADAAAKAHPVGALLFAGACTSCHGAGAPMLQQGRPNLDLVSAVQEDGPDNTVRAILHGLQPPTGGAGPYMPGFADTLTDPQIIEIAAYLRERYSSKPAWHALAGAITTARKEGSP